MKCLGLEHTVDWLGEPIQKPVKRVTFSSGTYFVYILDRGKQGHRQGIVDDLVSKKNLPL